VLVIGCSGVVHFSEVGCLVDEIEVNWELKSMLDEEDLGFCFFFQMFEEGNAFKYEIVLLFYLSFFLLLCL